MEVNHIDTSQYIEKKKHGDVLLPFVIYGTAMPYLYSYFPLHCHEEVEIVFVDDGTCRYTIDNEDVDLIQGDILIMMPWVLHSFRLVNSEDFFLSKAILLSLDMINNSSVDICSSKYFSPMLNRCCTNYCLIHCNSEHYDEFRELMEEIFDAYFKSEDFFELKLKAMLSRLFYMLLKYKYIKINDNNREKNEIEGVRKIIDYISENYKNPITLADLAKLVNLSETGMSRIFRNVTGMSCIDYVIDYRLSRAMSMLRFSDKSIIEIAYDTGFNNISYFNRTFKKHFNQTPSECRKNKGLNPAAK